MKENLGFGRLGNGVTVWDSNREDNNDYLAVAHISNQRVVSYRKCKISNEARNEIECFAENMKYTIICDKQGLDYIRNNTFPVFVLLKNQNAQLITSHQDFNVGIYAGGKLAVLKSKECSHVLQLLDQDYTYKQAIDTVLENSFIDKSKLVEELNLYI